MFLLSEMIAIVAMTSLSFLAWHAGRRLSRTSVQSSGLLFGLSLLFCVTFAWGFAGDLSWANVLPGSEVILWANFVPIVIAFVTGIATWTTGLSRCSRIGTVCCLAMIGISFLLMPMIRPLISPIRLTEESKWTQGVCLQSHEATCGAAAAATLLQTAGVSTDEATMVTACLTSQHGTEPLGLYKGLYWALARNRPATTRRPRIADQNPDRWHGLNQFPCIAVVRYDNQQGRSAHWLLGPQAEGHAVVVMGQDSDGWIIADPAIGKVHWSQDDFRQRFTGDAIYLGE